jgi:hypothetical protein
MRHVKILTLVLSLAAFAAPVCAQIAYQPLAPGCAWTYSDGAGHARVIAAAGPAVIQGEDVLELVWTEPDQVYHNFWSLDAEGAVRLHAAYNEDGFVVSYSPPILWLPAVAATQRCWSTATRIYWSLDDSQPWGAATITYCIVGGGVTTVPAGDFETIAVEASLPPWSAVPGPAAHDALGRRHDGGARVSTPTSYAAGVGLVAEDAWELTAYGGPTPTDAARWGEVKALYR